LHRRFLLAIHPRRAKIGLPVPSSPHTLSLKSDSGSSLSTTTTNNESHGFLDVLGSLLYTASTPLMAASITAPLSALVPVMIALACGGPVAWLPLLITVGIAFIGLSIALILRICFKKYANGSVQKKQQQQVILIKDSIVNISTNTGPKDSENL
jgi:hypothetical protein